MNSRSIKFRLVGWYAGLLTGIFLLLCTLLYLDVRSFLERGIREAQERHVRQLASVILARIGETGETNAVRQIREWYAPESTGRFIRVTRADGTVIYLCGLPQDGSFDPAKVPVWPAADREQPVRKVALGNSTLLVAGYHFQSAAGEYFAEFGSLLDPMETMLDHLFLQLALGLPLAVGIVAVGGYLLVQWALRPVEKITRAAEQITQLNLSERLPVAETGDELERLALALNRMIARLDDAFQNSRRFVGDASHDLRTPLTILRGELESMLEDPKVEPGLRERLASLLEEAMHLSKIVEQLFTLTKLDCGQAAGEWNRFDLAELAQTTADQMSLLAEDKHITMACKAAQPAFVLGDRSRIKQVIVNLLDNAIKYTEPEGRVEVRVRGVNGHVVLEVEDNGIGIPPEALPHVFERFYRVDKSRSGDTQSAGLGLSIVKSICQAHGAEIKATSEPQGGSCFAFKMQLLKK